MEAAQQSDDLADTVDYGALAQTAADVVGDGPTGFSRPWRGGSPRPPHRRPPDRGGRGHGTQAPPAPGPRRGLDWGPGRRARRWRRRRRPRPGAGPPAAFIGLGSNLGDRRALLGAAVATLRAGGDVVGVSPLYETEPVGGPEAQGPYLNLVVEL